ncbi:hypothetical protein F5Y13DRAFT_66634 [Hypoxylon sp. FL1857]|nr:hypothetical protein F5Y13DRAFT_66634 [Hypoxylon sp. FL1857]
MADARALLRAHRAENRIKHPHALYSNAGKLLCKVCHEPIKTEALWDAHIQGAIHQQKLQVLQSQPGSGSEKKDGGGDEDGDGNNKRKRPLDYELSDTGDDEPEDFLPRKPPPQPSPSSDDDNNEYHEYHEYHEDDEEEDEEPMPKRAKLDTTASNGSEKRLSPSELNRRASNTPVQGVGIAIPSRPATPAAGSNSATSTPKGVPVGRSPLIGSEMTSTTASAPTTQQNFPVSTQAAPPTTALTATNATSTTAQAAPTAAVDEAEWAAFESEIALASAPPAATAATTFSADATISAPALSAAQLAAKSQEEEHERRKHLLDAQIADEREDAMLAREAEFEEMEELEGRVRRLKERREELRKGSVANLRGAAAAVGTTGGEDSDMVMAKGPAADGKENNGGTIHEEDEDDDDEGDDEDGWDAFRFR